MSSIKHVVLIFTLFSFSNLFSQNNYRTVIVEDVLDGMHFQATIEYKPACFDGEPYIKANLRDIKVIKFTHDHKDYTELGKYHFPIEVSSGYLELSGQLSFWACGSYIPHYTKASNLSISIGNAGIGHLGDKFYFTDEYTERIIECIGEKCSDLKESDNYMDGDWNLVEIIDGNFETKTTLNIASYLLKEAKKLEKNSNTTSNESTSQVAEAERELNRFQAEEKRKAEEQMKRYDAEQRIRENQRNQNSSYSSPSASSRSQQNPYNSPYTPPGQAKIDALNAAQKGVDDFFAKQAERDRQHAQEKREYWQRQQEEEERRRERERQEYERKERITRPLINQYERASNYLYQNTEEYLSDIVEKAQENQTPGKPLVISIVPILIDDNMYFPEDYVVRAMDLIIHKPLNINLTESGRLYDNKEKLYSLINEKLDLGSYTIGRYRCSRRLRFLDFTDNPDIIDSFFDGLKSNSSLQNVQVYSDTKTLNAVPEEYQNFLREKEEELEMKRRASLLEEKEISNFSLSTLRNQNVFKSLDGSEWRLKTTGILRPSHYAFVNGKLIKVNPESWEEKTVRSYYQDGNVLEHPYGKWQVKYKILSQRKIKGGLINSTGQFVEWEFVRIQDTDAYTKVKEKEQKQFYASFQKAIRTGNTSFISEAIKNGRHRKVGFGSLTSTQYAIEQNSLSAFKILEQEEIQRGINQKQAYLNTAIRSGSQEIVFYLVEQQKANINEGDSRPLYTALTEQNQDAFSYLLSQGAKVQWIEKEVKEDRKEAQIVKMLANAAIAFRNTEHLEKAAAFEAFESEKYQLASRFLTEGEAKLFRFMLEHYDLKGGLKNTSFLHRAIQEDQPDIFILLMEKEFPGKKVDEKGLPAVHYFVEGGREILNKTETWKSLDFNQKDADGVAVLHKMVYQGVNYKHIGRILNAETITPNIRGPYGWTPLHFAARENHYYQAQILITNGADKAAKDQWERTPRDIAKEYNFKYMKKYVLK